MNAFIFIITAIFVVGGTYQQKETYPIFGKWKCVKLNTQGFQKFQITDAEKLQKSNLTITSTTFGYDEIDFIEPCNFKGWSMRNCDTSENLGITLELLYTKDELSKFIEYSPIDENGEFGCFNDCSIFYMKNDTLINICGGYTLFLIKED